ncbi:Uncharacterized protein TCM_040423 [Theobroma cacao]|uniref:Uncharacterized protein n=1 Tax=Theobroma cacao TaxID=3641 RepID=A0A061GRK0_THECC|nr:Uncharacterized protein TCM_040423 [Theobroma cacao]
MRSIKIVKPSYFPPFLPTLFSSPSSLCPSLPHAYHPSTHLTQTPCPSDPFLSTIQQSDCAFPRIATTLP